jgi:RES domain-containing protein
VRVWRLARRPFAALDGAGARLYGGRWNWPGQAIVYVSEQLSLAVLEVIVHLELSPEDFPPDYVKIEIEIPDALELERVDVSPRTGRLARDIGSGWYASGRTVGLLVPSVVVAEENNLLLNPRHPQFEQIKPSAPKPFRFDPRLLT